LKKGAHTVAVQRQYTGTAGRIENSQVAVYLTYVAPAGYAFVDRALYGPDPVAQLARLGDRFQMRGAGFLVLDRSAQSGGGHRGGTFQGGIFNPAAYCRRLNRLR
jgi:hypothetical protein